MAFTGFTLPDIKDGDLSGEKERRKILEYLYQLTEQLRYVLSNLDEENLSDGLSQTIQGACAASADASRELRDTRGNVSSLRQFADSLTLSVSNGASSSTIALTANGMTLASREIAMTGLATFASLSAPGATVIDGANIRTGTVSADRIDAASLKVRHLDAASGTFSSLKATAGAGIDLGGWKFTATDMQYGAGQFNLRYTGDGSIISSSGPMLIGPFLNGAVDSPLTLYGSSLHFTTGANHHNMRIWAPGTGESSLTPATPGTCNIGTGSYYFDYMCAVTYGTASARRLKTDIRDARDYRTSIDDLRPVTYRMIGDPRGKTHLGFIAEEVEGVCPLLVTYDGDGAPSGLDYGKFTVLLVDEVKALRRRVAELEANAA